MPPPLYEVRPTSGGSAELYFNGERKSTGTMDAITKMANDQIFGTKAPEATVEVAPTPTPFKSPDGAVSSTDVPTGQAGTQATNQATSALQPPKTSSALQEKSDAFFAKQKANLDTYMGSLKGSYDAQLAVDSQEYASLFASLASQQKNANQAGVALAAQLNPYSDPRIASTTGGYIDTINAKYNAQAESLKGQMNAARALKAANFNEAANKLILGAQEKQDAFQLEIEKLSFDMYKEAQDQINADRTFKLQQGNQEIALGGQASDDFRSLLTTLSGSPALQADIKTYQESGKISPGLMPIIEKGQQAGMSPDEAISLFSYQSDSVRKQEALDAYRANQLVIAQDRATNALNRQTSTQVKIATAQNLSQTSAALIAAGKTPGTIDYAVGLAGATVGSAQTLPMSGVEKYTNMGILSSQLGSLKKNIEAVDKNSALGNILLSRLPSDVQSLSDTQLTVLNNQVQALSGIIGKSVFGESGNLSNTDIQRVLNALPKGGTTAAVRDALYKNIVGLLAEKATLTLQNDASAGYQVATFAHTVKQINVEATALGASASTPTGGFDYEAWKKAQGI